MTRKVDVAVIGAGVIGLSVADRLAEEGRSVLVLDAGAPGREASWAGSGALSLIMPDVAPEPMCPLAALSQALWPDFAQALEARTALSVEYRRSGLLRLILGDEDPSGVERTVAWLREHDVRIAPVPADARRSLAPFVTEEARTAYYQPDLCQVRPPRLLQALLASLALRGVEVRAHDPVLDILREGSRVTGVRAASGTVLAGEVVLAAGAWAGELARRGLGLELPVEPVRGQVVLLEGPPVKGSPLILGSGGAYLIPRADGRILAGSTFERAGYDRSITAMGVHSILAGAIRLAPALANARVVEGWAGLRPQSPDKLPYLGRLPGLAGFTAAAGHFRDGLLLAPVTAHVVADVLAGRAPPVDLGAFAPGRMAPVPA